MKDLLARNRDIFTLHRIAGKTAKELGRCFGLSEGRVWQIIHDQRRAREWQIEQGFPRISEDLTAIETMLIYNWWLERHKPDCRETSVRDENQTTQFAG